MKERKNKNTRIPVDYEVREELKKLGTKGETYSDIIKRLINYYMERKKIERG